MVLTEDSKGSLTGMKSYGVRLKPVALIMRVYCLGLHIQACACGRSSFLPVLSSNRLLRQLNTYSGRETGRERADDGKCCPVKWHPRRKTRQSSGTCPAASETWRSRRGRLALAKLAWTDQNRGFYLERQSWRRWMSFTRASNGDIQDRWLRGASSEGQYHNTQCEGLH